MGLSNESRLNSFKEFALKVGSDNLFLLSSSISYYSALALAPFMLIILWVASILGQNVQGRIISYASENFSEQVGDMIHMVFNNVNEGVSVGSISGLIGLVVLLSTCSLVFLQFRYAFDVIYGHHDPERTRSWGEFFRERLFAMLLVFLTAILVIVSFTIAAFVEYIVGPDTGGAFLYRILVFLLNYLIYLVMFSLIHYFIPGRRQKMQDAVKIAFLTSFFFMLGNILLGLYLKSYAGRSVYGAAGTLLVFLVWSYYSSFTVFLSVEVFQHLRKMGKIKV